MPAVLNRPAIVGAVADDHHAPHVVATVERLAELHDLQPFYVQVCGHNLVGPVTWRVGEPYQEPPAPELTATEAENAFAAWRAAKPVFLRAGIQEGRDAYILGGTPPAIELRDLARKLRATAIVVGCGARRPRMRAFLTGSTAIALARECPTSVLFVDDEPLPLQGPVVCVLPQDRRRWDDQLHSAATLASRAQRGLNVYAMEPPSDEASPGATTVDPTPLSPDGSPAASIAALIEREHAGLLVVGHEPTTPVRAFLRGSMPIDLLLHGQVPLMLCSAPSDTG